MAKTNIDRILMKKQKKNAGFLNRQSVRYPIAKPQYLWIEDQISEIVGLLQKRVPCQSFLHHAHSDKYTLAGCLHKMVVKITLLLEVAPCISGLDKTGSRAQGEALCLRNN